MTDTDLIEKIARRIALNRGGGVPDRQTAADILAIIEKAKK